MAYEQSAAVRTMPIRPAASWVMVSSIVSTVVSVNDRAYAGLMA
jgi:hypothetical protein